MMFCIITGNHEGTNTTPFWAVLASNSVPSAIHPPRGRKVGGLATE